MVGENGIMEGFLKQLQDYQASEIPVSMYQSLPNLTSPDSGIKRTTPESPSHFQPEKKKQRKDPCLYPIFDSLKTKALNEYKFVEGTINENGEIETKCSFCPAKWPSKYRHYAFHFRRHILCHHEPEVAEWEATAKNGTTPKPASAVSKQANALLNTQTPTLPKVQASALTNLKIKQKKEDTVKMHQAFQLIGEGLDLKAVVKFNKGDEYYKQRLLEDADRFVDLCKQKIDQLPTSTHVAVVLNLAFFKSTVVTYIYLSGDVGSEYYLPQSAGKTSNVGDFKIFIENQLKSISCQKVFIIVNQVFGISKNEHSDSLFEEILLPDEYRSALENLDDVPILENPERVLKILSLKTAPLPTPMRNSFMESINEASTMLAEAASLEQVFMIFTTLKQQFEETKSSEMLEILETLFPLDCLEKRTVSLFVIAAFYSDDKVYFPREYMAEVTQKMEMMTEDIKTWFKIEDTSDNGSVKEEIQTGGSFLSKRIQKAKAYKKDPILRKYCACFQVFFILIFLTF